LMEKALRGDKRNVVYDMVFEEGGFELHMTLFTTID
jgi:hypothetical protein